MCADASCLHGGVERIRWFRWFWPVPADLSMFPVAVSAGLGSTRTAVTVVLKWKTQLRRRSRTAEEDRWDVYEQKRLPG